MGKYEKYHTKVTKTAKVRKRLYRFRILITTLITVFVLSISGFLIFKGKVTQNVQLPGEEFVYGGDISFGSASVLFGEPSYQYKEDGSDEWVDTKPTEPGKYSVRVLSKGAFGNNIYSTPVEFKINPTDLNLSLKSKNIQYGEEFELIDNLCPGDKIVDVQYSYDDITKKETNLKISGVTINSKDGEDRTSFYNFDGLTEEIKFIPKQVNVKASIEDKTYDGIDINVTDKITNELAKEDTITYTAKYYEKGLDGNYFEMSNYPVNAGAYIAKIDKESIEIKHGDLNVTSNYDLTLEPANFNINQREIIVNTGSKEMVYNGESLSCDDFVVDPKTPNELLDGHKLVINDGTVLEKNVEEKDNILTFNVIKDKIDYTNNYKITANYGKLKISKRPITISPVEIKDKTYDGKSLSYESLFEKDLNYLIKEGEIVGNDELYFLYDYFNLDTDIKLGASPKDAGHYAISFTGVNKDKSTLNAENNYEFTFENEEFYINKRNIKVAPQDIEGHTYDAKTYTYEELNTLSTQFNFLEETSLVDGEKLFFNVYFTDNEGNVVNVKNAQSYIVRLGEIDTTNSTININNYNIDKDTTKTFDVSVLDVNIDPDISKYKDNNYYGIKFDSVLKNNPSIINGEEISFNVNYVGNEAKEGACLPAGNYDINIDSYLVNNDANGVKNYNFIYNNDKKIEILPRDITLKPNFTLNGGLPSYTYGDFDLTNQFGNVLGYQLVGESNDVVSGESLSLSVDYKDIIKNTTLNELKFVGTYKVNIKDYIVTGGNASKDNYNFIYDSKEPIEIKINPRKIYLQFDELSKENYNGKKREYVYNDNFRVMNLASGDNITNLIVSSYFNGEAKDALDAGKYTFEVVNGYILDNKDNYEIDFDDIVEYTINPKQISITPNVKDKYTYGEKTGGFTGEEGYVINGDQLVEGQSLTVSIKYKDEKGNYVSGVLKNVGKYRAVIDSYNISTSSKENILASNYSFNTSEKPFEIAKRKITIKADPSKLESKIYSGDYYSYSTDFNNFIYNDDTKLAYDDKLSIALTFNNNLKVKDAAIYSPSFSLENCIFEGTSIDNYDINFINPVGLAFEIKPKDLTVDLHDYTKDNLVFDGDLHDYYNNVENNIIETGIKDEKLNIKVIYKSLKGYTEPKNADDYTYELDKNNSTISNNNSKLSNYNIITNKKTFTIKPKDVSIELINAASNSKTYDGIKVNDENGVFSQFKFVDGTSLVEGDSISPIIKFYKSGDINGYDYIKDAGNYTYKINSIIANNKNTILSNYNFNIKDINLDYTINKKEITIKPIDSTSIYADYQTGYEYGKNYDTITNFEFLYNTSLVNGEFLKVKVDTYLKNGLVDPAINAGEYDLKITDYITDNAGVNFANVNNYDITLKPGKLTVKKKNIIVDFGILDYDYGQYDLKSEYKDYDLKKVQNLESGVKLNFTLNFNVLGNSSVITPKNVDDYEAKLASFYFDSDNKVSKENYNLIFRDPIRFRINPLEITFTPGKIGTGEEVYNGKEHNLDNKNVIITYTNAKYGNKVISKLPYSDSFTYQLSASNEDKENTIKNVGIYKFVIDSYITNEGTLESNYIINKNFEAYGYTIKPREIEISLKSKLDKTYDGKPLEYDFSNFGNYKIIKGSFVGKDNIRIDELVYKKGNSTLLKEDTKNAGDYKLEINKHSFNDSALEKNYTIVYKNDDVNSNVTVKRKEVKIALNNKYFGLGTDILNNETGYAYDGLKHSYSQDYNNFTFVKGYENAIANNNKVTITLNYTYLPSSKDEKVLTYFRNVGKYQLTIKDVTIENDKSDNYDFILDMPYQINITKKKVNLTLEDRGKLTYQNNYDFVDHDIVENFDTSGIFGKPSYVISYKENGKLVDKINKVGVYDYNIDVDKTIIDYDNEKLPLSYNYDVNSKDKKLEVTKKNVTLELKDFLDLEYDGYNFEISNYLPGRIFKDMTDLDGNELDVTKFKMTINELLENSVNGKISNAMLPGTYTMSLSDIKFKNPDMDKNYNITISNTSKLERSKFDLVITPNNGDLTETVIDTITYGDDKIKIDDSKYIKYDYRELPDNHKLTIKYAFKDINNNITGLETIKDASEYEIYIDSYSITDKDGNEVKDSRFNVTLAKRNININKKELDLVPRIKGDMNIPGLETKTFQFNNSEHKYELYPLNTAFDEKITLNVDVLRTYNGSLVKENILHGGKYSLKTTGITADKGINLNNYTYDKEFNNIINEDCIYVSPQNITISPNSPIKNNKAKYNGNEYVYEDKVGNFNIVGGILSDEYITKNNVKIKTEINKIGDKYNRYPSTLKNAGSYVITINDILSDDPNFDYDYSFYKNETYLDIEKLQLRIKLNNTNLDKVYDGKEYDYNSLKDLFTYEDIEGSPSDRLLPNENIIFKFDREVTDVGNYDLFLKFDGLNNEDINYDVNIVNNKIKLAIKKGSIVIKFNDLDSLEYNGQNYADYFNDNVLYELSGIAEKDKIYFENDFLSTFKFKNRRYNTKTLSLIDAGEYEVILGDNFDSRSPIMKNYSITLENNRFNISQKDIHISLNDIVFEYNGSIKYKNNIRSEINKMLRDNRLFEITDGSVIYSRDKNKYKIEFNMPNVDVLNAGNYKLELTKFINPNYNFIIENEIKNNININIRPIEFSFKSLEGENYIIKTYDGKPVSYEDLAKFMIDSNKIRDEYTYEFTIYDENKQKYISMNEMIEPGNYTLSIKDGKLIFKDPSKADNYVFKDTEFSFSRQLNKRTIGIKPTDVRKVYDGKPVQFDPTAYDVIDGNDGLLPNHTIEVITRGKNHTVVNRYNTFIDSYTIRDENGKEFEYQLSDYNDYDEDGNLVHLTRKEYKYYNVYTQKGIINITKRQFNYTNKFTEANPIPRKTYDGNYYLNTEYNEVNNSSELGLAPNHTITVDQEASKFYGTTSADGDRYDLTFIVKNEKGDVVTDNYKFNNLTATDDYIIINRRDLNINLKFDLDAQSLDETGRYLSSSEYEITNNSINSGLIKGHELSVRIYQRKVMGKLRNAVEFSIIDTINGTSVETCYVTTYTNNEGGLLNE